MAKNRDETPVVLSRIYTRTGDDGTTALGDMSRTAKTDPRLAAYADVEEANSAIGVALALGDLRDDISALLTGVQNDLFDVGADLCVPRTAEEHTGEEHATEEHAAEEHTGEEHAAEGNAAEEYRAPLRIEEPYITRLEEACDTHNAALKPLRSFLLPGGTPGAALLHAARTVVRRAERSTWAALEAHADINPLTARYLNRLSDLLFILGRVANAEPGGPAGENRSGDVLWRPGG